MITDSAPAGTLSAHPDTDPHATLPGALASLLSPDVGVVHRLDDGLLPWDHPRVCTAYATLCDTSVLGEGIDARAGGMGADPGAARRAALGEAVERYSAVVVPDSRLLRAVATDLAPAPVAEPAWLSPALSPGPFPTHAPASNFVDAHLLRATGPAVPAWVAASRAYLHEGIDEGLVAVATSTGLACHTDPWQALASALLEVVERDAVMTTWYHGFDTVPIHSALRWTGDTGVELRFDRAVERYHLRLLPSPTGIPVVLGIALGAPGQPPVAVGAAAHPDLAVACRKALLETRQTFAWATLMAASGEPVPARAADIDGLHQHVAYYLDPRRLGAFDRLLDARGAPVDVDLARMPPPDPEGVCRAVLRGAARHDLACFAVDVTAPDVRAAGLWVVRAVVPDLYPLIVGQHALPAHPRLSPHQVISRDPHPFP